MNLWMGTANTSALLVTKQGVNTYSLTEKSAGTHSWAAGQVKNAPCLHIKKYLLMFICDTIVGIKTTRKTIKMYFSKIWIYNMRPQCHH
jgi:hypothetical protein